jgi:hypothetical protein
MKPLAIQQLGDEFGQYLILLICERGHSSRCHPCAIAAFAGWDAKLDDVVREMRCTKCRSRKCTARTMREQKPRGLRDPRD